jgi:hypothetical protein
LAREPQWPQGCTKALRLGNHDAGAPSGKENHMKFSSLILLVLVALWLGGCAETNSNRYRNTDPMVNLANTCAMCGATVDDNYFAGSAFRAIGPGNY